jgi:hypothetical protein
MLRRIAVILLMLGTLGLLTGTEAECFARGEADRAITG